MKKTFLTLVMLLLVCVIYAQPVLQEGLVLKYLVQQPAGKHAPVIILLHGYGSDERDLFELKSMLPGNFLIISARAPYALQGGGYQWYDLKMEDGKRTGKKEDIATSREKIITFIGQVVNKYSADARQVYVMGFSQGAIMSYEVGLTSPAKVRGIGPLSGKIYPSLKTLVKNTPDLKKLRIFVAHGTADDRISFAEGKAAVEYIRSLGLQPEFHEYAGMGHSISGDVMKDLVAWLGR
jgi:phospholipase/carboxylesterase